MKKLVRSVENHRPVPLNVSDFSAPFYLSPNQKAELFISDIEQVSAMKTIKDAVIKFNGVWPEFTWNESDKNKHAIIKTIKQLEDNEEGKIYPNGHIGKGGTSFDPEFCELVYTKSEFEAEAKRMGYINGYEWGKEYPTNGKRTDLPDDVVVQVKADCFFGWTRKPDLIVNLCWNSITAFKITDPRYKPVSEISESNPDAVVVSENPESNWFERGELPPVGTICEYTLGNSEIWYKCEIHYTVENDGVVMFAPHLNHKKYCSIHGSSGAKFRPVRTEREKFIDAGCAAMKTQHHTVKSNLGFLFDAGFRGPKVEK